ALRLSSCDDAPCFDPRPDSMGNEFMPPPTRRLSELTIRIGGAAVLLLAIGALGFAAPAQDDAKPPKDKEEPKAAKGKDDTKPPKDQDQPKPAKGKDDTKPPADKDQPKTAKDKTKDATAKKDEPKQPPVKLGLSTNDPRALQ